jgi:hypothetical protein
MGHSNRSVGTIMKKLLLILSILVAGCTASNNGPICYETSGMHVLYPVVRPDTVVTINTDNASEIEYSILETLCGECSDPGIIIE